MGKTFDQKVQDDQKLRDYLKSLEDELQGKVKATVDTMNTEIKAFYDSNKWDSTLVVKGTSFDFMQESTWTLDKLKGIIDVVGKALFGDTKAPEGVTVDKAGLGKELAAMANLELYVVGKAFEVISGVIESFGSASNYSYSSQSKSEPLGNGLRLWTVIAADSYKSTGFFGGDEIIEYLYSYQVIFSKGEAGEEGTRLAVKRYEDQIAVFTDKIEQLLDQLENDKITVAQYETLKAGYQKVIDAAQAEFAHLSK